MMGSADGPTEQMSAIVTYLERAGFVIVPSAQYDALMALRPIVAKVAYARAPLNDSEYREARNALAALRSAGIQTEGDGK